MPTQRLTVLALFPVLSILATLSTKSPAIQQSTDIPSLKLRLGYAGDSTCGSCHVGQSLSYSHTAHHETSNLMAAARTPGSFLDGSNTLKIADPAPAIGDPGVSYKMEQRDAGYFVTAITGFVGRLQVRSERIDLVIGAGVRGQSFLSWRNDALFELPVSYWTQGSQWINSPGYRNGAPNFDRVATPRCLECHVGYIEALSADKNANRFDRDSLVPGITCEVCHGPGTNHVSLYGRVVNPAARAAIKNTLILNPKTFSRDRQVDMCALCHNGASQQEIVPAFSYVPGEDLSKYLSFDTEAQDSHPDVHANQVGLLKRSRCYLRSPAMSCSTCHEVHAPERAAASYSVKCLSCHRVETCGMEKKIGPSIANNCIDCHMPVEQTNAIVSQTGNKVVRTSMRTHWIKAYGPAEDQ